jgi:hypothetical protein
MKNAARRVLIILVSLALAQTSLAQYVTGFVTDENGGSVGGATVFVAHTTISTVSQPDGSFEIPSPPQNAFEIVAVDSSNLLGVVKVTPETTSPYSIPLSASPASSNMPAASMSRDDLLEFFKSTAFAWTKNAGDIELLNPEALILGYDAENNIITALSDGPFRFRNPVLGYDVHIYNFQMGGNQVAYGWSGYAHYVPMTSEKGKDQKTWEKNRGKAYEGSQRHFLTSLSDGRLKKEEFAAYFVDGPGSQADHAPILEAELKSVYGAPQPVLFEGKIDGSKRLDFVGWLRVQYYGNGGDSRWERYIDRYWPVSELSEVMKISLNVSFFQLPDYQAIFDPTGIVWPTTNPSIQTMGYWSFFRLADTLPNDWMPE